MWTAKHLAKASCTELTLLCIKLATCILRIYEFFPPSFISSLGSFNGFFFDKNIIYFFTKKALWKPLKRLKKLVEYMSLWYLIELLPVLLLYDRVYKRYILLNDIKSNISLLVILSCIILDIPDINPVHNGFKTIMKLNSIFIFKTQSAYGKHNFYWRSLLSFFR